MPYCARKRSPPEAGEEVDDGEVPKKDEAVLVPCKSPVSVLPPGNAELIGGMIVPFPGGLPTDPAEEIGREPRP